MARSKCILLYLLITAFAAAGLVSGPLPVKAATSGDFDAAVPDAYWAREHQGTTKAISWPHLYGSPESPGPGAAPAAPPPGSRPLSFPDYYLPSPVTICGEKVPTQHSFVRERLEYEFLHIVNSRSQVRLWQRRAALYFPVIEAKLKKAGLPDDLKYLAVAESDLRPSVISPSGALGLWQFMPATARGFGLAVNKTVDERHLPEPLLDISVTYLKRLYRQFGSWPLAMAAYNCGEGCVSRNINRQGQNSYFNLNLPRETERYVYRITAIKIIMNNPASYGFGDEIPAVWRQAAAYDETRAVFPQAVTWAQLAQLTGSDYKTIRRLNPHLRGAELTGGPLRLRVPPGKGYLKLITVK